VFVEVSILEGQWQSRDVSRESRGIKCGSFGYVCLTIVCFAFYLYYLYDLPTVHTLTSSASSRLKPGRGILVGRRGKSFSEKCRDVI
jgi:hypothetical protein